MSSKLFNMKCLVCAVSYDQNENKPLILQCGHTFCKSCLHRVKESLNCCCPRCRHDWSNVNVDDLAVCYQLMDVECGDELHGCREHGYRLDAWCGSCSIQICVACIKTTHEHCDVHPQEDAVKTIVRAIKIIETETKANLDMSRANIRNAISLMDDGIGEIHEMKRMLMEAQMKFTNYKESLQIFQSDIETLHNDLEASKSISADQQLKGIAASDVSDDERSVDSEEEVIAIRRIPNNNAEDEEDKNLLLQNLQTKLGKVKTLKNKSTVKLPPCPDVDDLITKSIQRKVSRTDQHP